MYRLHHDTVVRASASTSTPMCMELVPERLRSAGRDLWMGWTVADDVVVIAIAGDVCTAGVPKIIARVDELIRQFPARTVLLDLSRVAFADARAVTMLVLLDRTCRESGSELSITAVSAAVSRLLDVCGWPIERKGGADQEAARNTVTVN
jgi:anti-anti-sigma factor